MNSHLLRYDADELETMAEGIVAAIRKYEVSVVQLTNKQVWDELQKKEYGFQWVQ